MSGDRGPAPRRRTGQPVPVLAARVFAGSSTGWLLVALALVGSGFPLRSAAPAFFWWAANAFAAVWLAN